jgi:hypothetical protein
MNFDERFFDENFGILKWQRSALLLWILGIGFFVKWIRGLWIESLVANSDTKTLCVRPIFFYAASMASFALCIYITIWCAKIYEAKETELEAMHRKINSLSSEKLESLV